MQPPRPIDRAPQAEIERSAFNAAFYELGLPWHWDDAVYGRLANEPCERSRVRQYVQSAHPHLLRAYDVDFLADAVLRAKQRCQRAFDGSAQGPAANVNWADARWGETGF
jgi:hypothetical protein